MRTKTTFAFCLLLFAYCMSQTVLASNTPVTLTLWHHWDSERLPLLNEIVARFEQEYPWIKVEAVLKPHPTMDQLTLGIMSGTAPDLAMIEFSNSLSLGMMGALLPLGNFAQEEDMNLSEIFYPPIIYTLENYPLLPGKTYYYLPTLAEAGHYLYYNKHMFESAGLNPATDVPSTWSEMETVSRKLVFRKPDGRLQQIGMDVAAIYDWTFSTWLDTAGGHIYSSDLQQAVLNRSDSLCLETLEWMVDFTDKVNFGMAALRQLDSYAFSRFLREEAAMLAAGAYNIYMILERSPHIDFGMTELPHRDGYDYHPTIDLGWGYGILADCEHPEEAWLLLKWLTMEPEGAGHLTIQQGRPAAAMEINLQEEYFEVNPQWHAIQANFNRSIPAQPSPPLTGARAVLKEMVDRAVNYEMSPVEAIEWANHEIQKQLDGFWKE